MVRRGALPWVSAVLAAGCSVPLEPSIPFSGPAPEALVVAPAVDLTGDPVLERSILHGTVPALRRRGYRVLPLEVGIDLLRRSGLEQAARMRAPGLAEIEGELGVDAVVLIVVNDWNVLEGDELEMLEYDLDYTISSTVTEQVVWSHRVTGKYRRARFPDEPRGVPGGRPEVDPVILSEPVTRGFRSASEFLMALHRSTFHRMPVR